MCVYVLATKIYTAVKEDERALMIAGISNYKAENYSIHSLHFSSARLFVEIVLYFFITAFLKNKCAGRVNNKFNNLGYRTSFTKATTARRLSDWTFESVGWIEGLNAVLGHESLDEFSSDQLDAYPQAI